MLLFCYPFRKSLFLFCHLSLLEGNSNLILACLVNLAAVLLICCAQFRIWFWSLGAHFSLSGSRGMVWIWSDVRSETFNQYQDLHKLLLHESKSCLCNAMLMLIKWLDHASYQIWSDAHQTAPIPLSVLW